MATYTNLFTNPRPIDSIGWTTSAGTGGVTSPSILTTAGGPAGGQARRVTWTTANTGGVSGQAAGGSAVAATVGATYSIAGYVRSSKAQSMVARVQFFDAGLVNTGTVDGTLTAVSANTWTELKIEGQVAPANTTLIRCALFVPAGSGSLWAAGDTLDAQAPTIVAGATVPEPFHGSRTNTSSNTYAWTGTTDASTSTLTVSDALAVPTGLAATPVSGTQINVSWNAATGATGYDLERNGVVVVTGQPGTTYSDTGLTPSTLYTYRVRSVG